MAYKSLFDNGSKANSIADALGRISQDLAPKVTTVPIQQSPLAAIQTEQYDPIAEQYPSLQSYMDAGGMPTQANREYYNQLMIDELQPRVDAQAKREAETGLLSYGNLSSNNPLVSVPTNLLNWGAMAGAQLGNLGINLYSGSQLSDVANTRSFVPEVAQQAWTKQKQGVPLSPEETNALQERTVHGNGFWGFGARTMQELMDEAQEKETQAYARMGNKKLGIPNRLDTDSWYNPRNEKAFEESLGDLAQAKTDWAKSQTQWKAGDYSSSILSALSATKDTASDVAGALVENPMYLGDLMANTAPYLLQRTMGGTMAADAQRLLSESRRTFQDRTGRVEPTTGEQLGMVGATAGYSALNFLENITALKALQGRLPTTGIAEALGAGTVGRAVAPISNIGKAALVEGAAELGQNQIEQSWGNLSTEFDLVDNIKAATLGAAMGAGFATPGAAIQYGNMAQEGLAGRTQQRAEDMVGTADQSMEDLVNPESPLYAPDKAINRILASELPNTAPENLDALKEQTDAIYTGLQEQYSAADQVIQEAENIDTLRSQYAEFQTKAEANLEKFKDNPEMIEKVQTLIAEKDALLTESITRAEDNATKLDELTVRRDELKQVMDRTQPNYDAFNTYYNNMQPKEPQQTTEADEILGAPSAAQGKRIQELMADESVPEATRNTLRVVNDAIIAQNAIKDLGGVHQDVTKGGIGYRGLAQYMSHMGKAVERNEPTRQESLLRDITNFEFSQSNKLTALQQAQEDANRLNVRIQVTRNTDGTWNVHNNEQLPNTQFKKNQGVLVHPTKADGTGGSQRLIDSLGVEVAGIVATNQAMKEMANYSQSKQVQEQPIEQSQPVSVDPFQDAMDAMNNIEREFGRDTAARERSNNLKTVPQDLQSQQTAPVSEQSVSVANDTTVQDVASPTTQTTQPTPTIESDVNTQERPADTIAVQGAMSPLVNSTKESVQAEKAKPIAEQNLITSGFTQRVRDGLNSPLVMADNFRSNYLKPENLARITERLGGMTPTAKTEQTLNTFSELATNQFPTIRNIVNPQKNTEYRYTAFSDYLLNDAGQLDENTATAISAAIFSWLGENGGNIRDTKEDVVKKIGLTDIDEVPPNVFKRLTSIGVHRATLAASLGQRVYQSLGMKMYKDVDPKRQSKLEMALGHIAIATMLKDGLVQQNELSAQEMLELRSDTMRENDNAKTDTDVDFSGTSYFIHPMREMVDGVETPIDRINEIREASKGSQSVVSKVFGFTPNRVLPSTQPITEVQQEFNAQGSAVPQMAKDVFTKMQSTPYRFNSDITAVMDKLVDNHGDKLKQMFGYVPQEELSNRHFYFQESQKAVNEAIERSLDIAQDARIAVENGEFYLPQNMWNNQRSGYESAFNLQADKVHRSLASLVADRTEVPVNQMPFDKDGNLTEYGKFLRALAYRMEDAPIDFQGRAPNKSTVDKVSYENFIPFLGNYINSPRVRAATEAMVRLRTQDEVNPTDLDTVIDMVKEFGMGALSFSALNTLATLQEAADRGDRTFESYLPGESDGVTNGYALTQVMLNTANEEGYKNVGIFPDSNITNVPQYRERGGVDETAGRDVYQQLGDLQKHFWKQVPRDNSTKGRAVRSLDYVDSSYGERSGAKRAATPFNYGSGSTSVNRASARGTLKAFYKKLEKSVKSGPKDVKSDIAAVNAILKYANENLGYSVELAVVPNKPLEFLLTKAQEAAFISADVALRGESTNEALKALAGPFINSRDRKTLLATTSFDMYQLVRDHLINQAKEKNTAEGKTPTVKGKAIEGLTAEQLQAIDKQAAKYMPSLDTPMGIASRSANKSSIPLMKQQVRWDHSDMYKMQMKFNGVQGMRTGVREYQYVDPGVSGLALYIQSHDAYITFRTMAAHDVQNFHDANAGNANQLEAIAQTQNEAFLDAVTVSHAGKAFTKAMLKPLKGIVDTNLPLTKTSRLNIRNTIYSIGKRYGLKTNATYAQVLTAVVNAEYNADIAKMERILNQEYINQYGTQGGEYKITAEKKAEINKRLDTLKRDKTKAIEQATEVGTALGNYVKGASTSAVPSDVALPTQPTTPVKPTMMDAIFGDSPIKNPKDLINRVKQELNQYRKDNGNVGRYANLYTALLDIAAPSLPANLDIRTYDSFDAIPEDVRGTQEANSSGTFAWFVTGDKPQLILVSDGNVNTGVFVHEILHAASANAIRQIQKNPNKYPKAQETLDKLQSLLDHVKTKVTDSSPEIVKYGTQNLDEFLATGMTDPAFIDFLDSITDVPKAARGKNRILSAFRSMIDSVLDALYAVAGKGRKYNPKELTAYEALLLDTTEFLGRTQAINTTTQMDILGAPKAKAKAQVSQYTAKELFNVLSDGTLDPQFSSHLNDLMQNVADNLLSDSTQEFLRSKGTYSPEQLWDKALQEGKAPYSTAAITAGFNLSAQEQFAVEALEVTINQVIKDKAMTPVFRELQRIYDQARNTITVESFHNGDWNTASKDQKEAAQSKYNHLFDIYGKGDHFAKFMSLALGSQEVNSMMNFKVGKEKGQDLTAFDRLVQFMEDMVNYVYGFLTRTQLEGSAKGKLPILAEQLVDIDLKNRNKALTKVEEFIDQAEEVSNVVTTKARERLAKLLKRSPTARIKNKYVKIAHNLATTSANSGNVFGIMDVLKEWRNAEKPNERLGFGGELMNEIASTTPSQTIAQKLLNAAKQNENMRRAIKETIKTDILSRFNNEGKDLTREQRKAITYGALRTDLQSLMGPYEMNQIHQFVKDDVALAREVKKLEKRIKDPIHITRTRDLAWYMVSGEQGDMLAKNATAIANNAGFLSYKEASQSVIDTIDSLASLYAIQYLNKGDRNALVSIMDTEIARGKDNGIESLLKQHQSMVIDSRDTLFASNPLSMAKGYLPEITNPNKEIVVARSANDVQRYSQAYYKKIGDLGRDPLDPNQQEVTMFFSEDAGHQRYVSGAIALNNYGRKGHEVTMLPDEMNTARTRLRQSISKDPNYDPRNKTKRSMVPSYDTEGNIMSFNYEMTHRVRDDFLERNNDFSELVGTFAAAGYDKLTTAEQNDVVIETLHQDFLDNYSKDPFSYLRIEPGSSDPVISQAWAMMPQSTRDHIRAVTGESAIYVKNDIFLMVFGARKLSITTAFDKNPDFRNVAEQAVVSVMQAVFSDNARVRTAQAEKIWMEAVQVLKSFVVIRNLTTMVFNIAANTLLLMAHGVTPTTLVRDTVTSIKGGMQYRKDRGELIKLQAQQRANIGDADAIQKQIDRIQDSLERNPLKSFIDEGMLSGIVEDIDPNEDTYSYKSGLERKYEGMINKVPKTVRTAAAWAFVSPGTPAYQFLHSATQYSDFSAKYVLYKQATTRRRDRLSHDEAIQLASDNFINYDIPTSAGMQYMNDIGLLMFTKYSLRIQKALFQLLAKRPASAIGQAIVMNAITNLPPGIDPIVFNQWGNPLRSGPFGLSGAWDEPFPIQALKTLF